ncbi:MAG: methyltransferase family protein [Anaerolineales bacterium]
MRIQRERDQAVVDKGPYRWIRHPGYAGGALSNLASPLMLGSFWAMIPALSICILLIVRTKLEDELLLADLAGYRNYVQQIRYRLVPGLW